MSPKTFGILLCLLLSTACGVPEPTTLEQGALTNSFTVGNGNGIITTPSPLGAFETWIHLPKFPLIPTAKTGLLGGTQINNGGVANWGTLNALVFNWSRQNVTPVSNDYYVLGASAQRMDGAGHDPWLPNIMTAVAYAQDWVNIVWSNGWVEIVVYDSNFNVTFDDSAQISFPAGVAMNKVLNPVTIFYKDSSQGSSCQRDFPAPDDFFNDGHMEVDIYYGPDVDHETWLPWTPVNAPIEAGCDLQVTNKASTEQSTIHWHIPL